MARNMKFDILADASKAKREFESFEDKALGISASIAAAYAGTKLAQGLDDALAADASGDKLAAQFALGPEAAANASAAAAQVYRDGMGESLEEVHRAVSEVGEDMVDLSSITEAETAKIATDALTIADVFDKDVSEVTRAAGQLMKNGVAKDYDEAFDIITTGMQSGLDMNDDFLDSLWEYSEPLGALGIEGPQAIAMFQSAIDAGGFSVDKAGDAINEFATRSIDGSQASRDAYAALGMDADDMMQKIAAGGPGAQEAFSEVITGLASMDDAVAQDAAGVALFGSMWEDAGAAMVLSMDPAQQSIADVTDATETMGDAMYDNGTARAESMKRSFDGWWQNLAGAPGLLGDAAAASQAFGGDILAAGGAVGSLAVGLRGLGLAQKMQAMWSGIVTGATWLWNAALNANPIGLIVLAIAALVGGLIWAWNNVDWFREGLISAWEWIADVWSAAGPWFEELWSNIVGFFQGAYDWILGVFFNFTPLGLIISNWGPISEWFAGMWDSVTGFFQGALDWLIDVFFSWSPLGLIIDNWGSIIDWFADLPGMIFDGLGSLYDTITTPFRNAFNAVAGLWNDTVGSISFTVPDWVGMGIGGKGWSLPQIPMLASGGILTAATLFLGGEGGESEVVAPLSQLAAFMEPYIGTADATAPRSRFSTDVGDIYVSMDGVELVLKESDGTLLGRVRSEAEKIIRIDRRAQRVAHRGR